jgi:hypothetical protein
MNETPFVIEGTVDVYFDNPDKTKFTEIITDKKPKPLRWSEFDQHNRVFQTWNRVLSHTKAKTTIGTYSLGRECDGVHGPESGRWILERPVGKQLGPFKSDVAAKAAAYADLCKKIEGVY